MTAVNGIFFKKGMTAVNGNFHCPPVACKRMNSCSFASQRHGSATTPWMASACRPSASSSSASPG
eukprot:4296651-Alexandrium_andersonii.AAC.1